MGSPVFVFARWLPAGNTRSSQTEDNSLRRGREYQLLGFASATYGRQGQSPTTIGARRRDRCLSFVVRVACGTSRDRSPSWRCLIIRLTASKSIAHP
jgi:hypothetical protein